MDLNKWVKDHLQTDWYWSSIQINRNTVATPHEDSRNKGISLVILLGNFTGGAFICPEDGIHTNITGQAIWADGRRRHWSEKFEGTRYSLVVFEHSYADRLPVADKEKLHSLGFRLSAPSGDGAADAGGPSVKTFFSLSLSHAHPHFEGHSHRSRLCVVCAVATCHALPSLSGPALRLHVPISIELPRQPSIVQER